MKNNKIIFVQGLGVIGSINAYCIAYKKKNFDVIGFEAKNKNGKNIIEKINSGHFPFNTTDKKINSIVKTVYKKKNFIVTNDYKLIKKKKSPEVILCCLALKYYQNKNKQIIENKKFIESFKEIISTIDEKTLIIVQTSLPPGFSKKYLLPLAIKKLKQNTKGKYNTPLFSYSYERVTPGRNLTNSFLKMPRVFACNNLKAKKNFVLFFSKILNFKNSLLALDDITECETGKILENSYRAVNIAFINEWMDYSKKLKLNLNKILKYIRLRPTHSNIRYPGLGVGGFCLTKDPIFGRYSHNEIFNYKNDKFLFSTNSISVNKKMILHTIEIMKEKLKNLRDKKILLVGVTYLEGSDDIRSSPSINLGKILETRFKSKVTYYDKFYFKHTDNYNQVNFNKDFFDAIIFCVKGSFSKKILKSKIIKKTRLVLDTNQIFDNRTIEQIKNINKKITVLGNYNT